MAGETDSTFLILIATILKRLSQKNLNLRRVKLFLKLMSMDYRKQWKQILALFEVLNKLAGEILDYVETRAS